jgi:mannose-6-phosphate isomerase
VRPAQFEAAIDDGSVARLVPRLPVKSGDSFFVPGGRLHAIGRGSLLVEIQENSDTTYRVFDWARTDDEGRLRPLHRTESMRAINFEDYEPQLVRAKGEQLLKSPHFVVEQWNLRAARVASERAAFAIFVCLEGAVKCGEMEARPGDFFLVPACAAGSELRPAGPATSVLRVTLPV